MPKLDAVLETALYVDDLDRAHAFYRDVLGLEPLFEDARLVALDVSLGGVLLLFLKGSTTETVELPFGTIPPHDASGQQHIAFSIDADALEPWQAELEAHGVAIEGRTDWPSGAVSVYFRDPDGHLLELATPGLWKGY